MFTFAITYNSTQKLLCVREQTHARALKRPSVSGILQLTLALESTTL